MPVMNATFSDMFADLSGYATLQEE
jgi:hypothetical protein